MSQKRTANTDERLNQLNARLEKAVACLSNLLDNVEWQQLFNEIVEMRVQQSYLMEAKVEQLKLPGTRQPDKLA
jgi:hypothetical protein